MSYQYAKVIVNPAAGANRTWQRWRGLRELLKQLELLFDYVYTESVGHAVSLSREAVSSGYRYLVAVGGDGTINEVANGIITSGCDEEIDLGCICTGRGGDFIRSIGLHRQPDCRYLVGRKRQVIDAGLVEYNQGGDVRKRYFVNAAGLGFDAAVVKKTESSPRWFHGTVPYLLGVGGALAGYRNTEVSLSIDGQVSRKRVLGVVVANGQYFGGGMQMAPRAKVNDGKLEVVTLGDVSKLDLMKTLPKVYRGRHASHPKVSMQRAEAVTVTPLVPMLLEVDGELLGEGPASFSIKPAALKLVV